MSDTTPRLGLYKPADDGSEPINVATDLNDNLEKIDSFTGFVPATSAIPPSTTFDGMGRYDTDTGVVRYLKGAAWVQLLSSGVEFVGNIVLNAANRIGIGVASPAAIVDVQVTNATTVPLTKYKSTAEGNPRLQIDSDGIRSGPGTTATDVRIYRSAANQWSFVGSVSLGSTLSVTGAATMADVSANNVSAGGTFDVAGAANFAGVSKVSNMFILTGQKGVVSAVTVSVAATSKSQAVVFPTPFATAPVVLTNFLNAPGGSSGWIARAINVTTTGFTIFASGSSGTWVADFSWIAIGT
jgi:H-type lectin domain